MGQKAAPSDLTAGEGRDGHHGEPYAPVFVGARAPSSTSC
jgi:hypothetical protein